MSADPVDVGPRRSVHRADVLGVVWLVVLAALCLAVVAAFIVMPFGRSAHVDAWKRWGGGAIFLAGGLMLLGGAWFVARTRVELCDGGLRYFRSSAIAVPWDDITRIELTRINGRPRVLVVYTARERLAISAHVQRFDEVFAALRAHAPVAPPSIPPARARRAP